MHAHTRDVITSIHTCTIFNQLTHKTCELRKKKKKKVFYKLRKKAEIRKTIYRKGQIDIYIHIREKKENEKKKTHEKKTKSN